MWQPIEIKPKNTSEIVSSLNNLKTGPQRPQFVPDVGEAPKALAELGTKIEALDDDFAVLIEQTCAFLQNTSETFTQQDEAIARQFFS